MDLNIKNKVALVLASSKGLGQAIAMSLAAEGVKVAVTGRNQADVDATVTKITAQGGSAYPLIWDLYDHDLIESKITEVEKQLGPIDILVNNTGGPPPTTAANQSSELWQQNFNHLVLSIIKITDRVLPGMKARGWGRIITSASSGVISPIPNLAISNTLRSALVGWSKTLSNEVAKNGITVNVILPGRIATARIGQLDQARAERENKTFEEVTRESVATIAMGRYGTPKEYGDVVAFIASDLASYMTGTLVRVDGGAFAGH